MFLLFPALTRAETGVQAWVQRYNGPGKDWDLAKGVVVDASNNVIVAGYSRSSLNWDDYATFKYSSAGVPLWTNRYNGPAGVNDQVRAMALDGSNNVVVTGSSFFINELNPDYATIKYSSAGTPLWTNRYNGSGNSYDWPYGVAVDGSNNVIVTGQSTGSGSGYDYATIKYSSAGARLWTNRFNGPGNGDDYAYAVAVDGSNDVIVTGYANCGGGALDYVTIKYSSEGAPLWTNRYDGPENLTDSAYAVVVDGGNNVIVTGDSYVNSTNCDFATIKYSSAGVPLWTNRYDGPGNLHDQVSRIAVDGSDNVIVTGGSYFNSTNCDFATIEYSSAGVPLWTNYYGGPENSFDRARAMAVDGSNNVIVTGDSYVNSTNCDHVTIKYSSTGAPLWTNRYNGPADGNDFAGDVAVDRSDNVIVTGTSIGIGSYGDYVTIKYICVRSPVITDLRRTNRTFQMRVDDVLQPGTLVIEASTNLAGWLPVFTNTVPTNVLFYTDPEAGDCPWRFYRAFQFP